MLAIGLTGGISSGKTAVSEYFAELGIDVIDADVVAHQLTEKGSPHLECIFDHFGQKSMNDDGTLNRRFVRKKIFSSPDDKAWLEDYLHPRIRQRITNAIAELQSPYCIVVIPLLAEASGINYVDRILVVDTEKENQIKRTIKRDHVSSAQALQIINQQATNEHRLAIADDVIHNNGTLEQLKQKVTELNQKYLSLAQS
ncbi:MAG: dephospho-CoA kinase [Coxiellaceae bacterium]|nr:dephospho-CoA kinase [Coxiellaceae bacterium]